MKEKMRIGIMIFAASVLIEGSAAADDLPPENEALAVEFQQHLNEQLPLDLVFQESGGGMSRFGDLLDDKASLLVLGYNECPMLCSLVLNGMIDALHEIKQTAGKDFSLISVSIDPTEGREIASAKKDLYLKRYGRRGAAEGWHFLTGDQESIGQLAEAVGFGFARDAATGEYAHPSGFLVLTPDGKISRYFFEVDYRAEEVQLALAEAAGSRIGSPIKEMILLCFQYNPLTGKYGTIIMNGLRVTAILTVLALVGYIGRSIAQERRTYLGRGGREDGGER